MSLAASIISSTLNAGTPLLIAAVGIIIHEKSGVLNLGIEGIMLMGAVSGFAVTHATGSFELGFLAGMGVGLLLGILSSGSGSTEYVERVNTSPSTENFKFGYVFSKVKKVRVEGYKPEYPGEDAQHARLFAAKTFVEVAAKTAVDFGFTRVGPIWVNFFRESNWGLDWNYIWQPLENEQTNKTSLWRLLSCR